MIVRVAFVSLVLLLVGGCQTMGDASPNPTVAPSTPAGQTIPGVDAVELAEVAVREYLAVSAAISAGGGIDTSAIDDVVSEAWRIEELAGFKAIRELGVVPLGAPIVTKLEVTALAGITVVSEAVVAVCTSTSGVSVVDDDGDELPVDPEVHFLTVFVIPRGDRFVVDGVDMVEDTSWCVE